MMIALQIYLIILAVLITGAAFATFGTLLIIMELLGVFESDEMNEEDDDDD